MYQFSDACRNASIDAIESTIGASPTLQIRSGSPPANCAASATGILLASMTLPVDWMSNASAGLKTLLGTWQAISAAATGTAAHFRIVQAGTCHWQGTVGMNLVLATNALTAVNGNVLNFASTTGVAVGQLITGTGIPFPTFVLALTSTTVTMSVPSTAGVANAASITFTGDLSLDNTSIAIFQQVTVTAASLNAGGA